jgi:hypothetical protein
MAALRPVTISRLRLAVPRTGDRVTIKTENEVRRYRFAGREGTLEFNAGMQNVPFTETIHTNGNTAPGRGTRGAIPLTLMLEATNIAVKPDAPLHLNVSLRLNPGEGEENVRTNEHA